MNRAVIYIHGQGGSAEEANHYQTMWKDVDVFGMDYKSETSWEAKEEFPTYLKSILQNYDSVSLIANSVGAYYAMLAFEDQPISKATFISPIVNMEKLITDWMMESNVSEVELETKKEIPISYGRTLSWKYLCYVRKHSVHWTVPTEVLVGENDSFTSLETVQQFSRETGATITVMKDGEHWFHTEQQMEFLDEWIRRWNP